MTSRILIGCMLSDARSDCVAGRKYERVSRGVFHLPRNSGNSGWDVNGQTCLVCSTGKFPE